MTMTEEHKFKIPTFCRILGFGEGMAGAIANLETLPYEKVSAEMATVENIQIKMMTDSSFFSSIS